MLPSSANPASNAPSENQENRPLGSGHPSSMEMQQENQPPSSSGNRGRQVGFSSPMKFASSNYGTSPQAGGQNPRSALKRGLRDGQTSSPMRFDHLSSQPQRRSDWNGRDGAVTPAGRRVMNDQRSGTTGRASNATTPRARRGDVQIFNRELERFLTETPRAGRVQSDLVPATDDGDLRTAGHLGVEGASQDVSTEPGGPIKAIWGTTVNIQESMNMFKDFLLNFTQAHKLREQQPELDDLLIDDVMMQPFYPKRLRDMAEAQKHFNLNLDCSNIRAYPPSRKLYFQMLRFPQEIIPIADFVFREVFMDMFPDLDIGDKVLTVRPFNTGRVVNMRELDPADIDQLVTVKGLLTRASPIIPDMKTAFFQCSVCETTVKVGIDRGRIEEPTKCPREACNARNSMKIVHNRCEFSDKQLARLQETPDEVPDGQTPQTVSLYLYDDLVDVAKAGDRLQVTGIFRAVPVRVNPRQRTVKNVYKTYLDIVHIQRTDKRRLKVDDSIVNDQEMIVSYNESDRVQAMDQSEIDRVVELSEKPNIYDLLANSIAPSIFGMEDVKKGVLLQLFGAVNKFSGANGAPRIRGDINILIIGDPGVSKSQLLRYVHEVSPRGIYTSGKGSSAVGLTAYVTTDPETRQLVLESGALVLSDGGICCIDEFDKMSESTRSVLHEVMEQQTVSIAKAGIITTLNARTSILASANPIRSQFDRKLSIVENINLPPSLMSRFDLLYLILDKANEWDDRRLAQHITGLYLEDVPAMSRQSTALSVEELTRYINYAKNMVHPVITEEAGQQLVKNYVDMRQLNKSNRPKEEKSPSATTRQLESMIRLSEAHARMRLSQTVDMQDVEEAHRLILSAMQSSAVDPTTGQLDWDLVVTGHSARSRREHDLKKRALRDLIAGIDRPKLSRNELLQRFRDQSSEPIAEKDFAEILSDLDLEGLISIRGDVIRKLEKAA